MKQVVKKKKKSIVDFLPGDEDPLGFDQSSSDFKSSSSEVVRKP